MPDIVEVVRATGALDATREAAEAQAAQAQALIACLPESIYKDSLRQLSIHSVRRST